MKQTEKIEEKLKNIKGDNAFSKRKRRKYEKKLKAQKLRESSLNENFGKKKDIVDIDYMGNGEEENSKSKKKVSKSRLKSYGLMELEKN